MYFGRLSNLTDAFGAIKELRDWTIRFTNSIQEMYQKLTLRTEEMIMQGTIAQRPDATGRNRFYFATDTKALYYDDGAWQGPI